MINESSLSPILGSCSLAQAVLNSVLGDGSWAPRKGRCVLWGLKCAAGSTPCLGQPFACKQPGLTLPLPELPCVHWYLLGWKEIAPQISRDLTVGPCCFPGAQCHAEAALHTDWQNSGPVWQREGVIWENVGEGNQEEGVRIFFIIFLFRFKIDLISCAVVVWNKVFIKKGIAAWSSIILQPENEL